LVNWTDNLLAKEGRWVCLKGKTPLEEIQALPPHVVLESVDPVTVPGLEAQRCLVWLLKA
jgi:16S rRNA (guanine527-N7)-methyltransferase